MRCRYIAVGILAAFIVGTPLFGEEPGETEETAAEESAGGEADLAKTAQNPVGDLISLPLQNNMSFGVGPDDRTQNVLNIQPVWPVALGKKVNLITRTILPVISQPAPGSDRTNGIGDLNFTGFFSPRNPGKVIWGVGPAMSFPTASDDVLGSGKFSLGPSVVVLTMPGQWVIGGLVSNLWSVAGDDDRCDVNSFLFQYFVNYNFPNGWYFTSAPIITSNRKAESGEQWTVPFGGGVGKLLRIGGLPVNVNSQIFYNVEAPSFGPDWQWRFQVQLLFPK